MLVSFQLEQSGQAVRIVDKDGSVYAGSLLAADLADRLAPTEAAKPATAGAPDALQRRLAPGAAPASPPPASSFQQTASSFCFFRVAGTNRTLNQKVVFSGKLFGVTNAAAAATGLGNAWDGGSANRLGATPLIGGQVGPAPLSPSRIAGKAVIGRGREIEINAVPVP